MPYISILSLSSLSGFSVAMSTANIYSCMTCRLLVTNQDLQREHFKSDWHRYNLKRKVASLPFVTIEAFLHKASAQEALLIAVEKVRRQNWNCFMCKKHFASEKQLNNHLTSKKHLSLASSSKSPNNKYRETQADQCSL